jgi:3'(2'), 5'-bisphosphate nucleotidase
MKDSVPHIIELLQRAGSIIMDIYALGESGAQVEWKSDNSPLTLADRESHEFLVQQLANIDSQIPIMSEESLQTDFELRRNWPRYWCLDPLDGTKEFIKRNGQFTINLALIEHSVPLLGFIHVPVTGYTYWALKGQGAFVHNGDTNVNIRASQKNDGWIAVSSSSHSTELDNTLLSKFPVTQYIKAGSALKFCYIASGVADVYHREGPTMEWDTAAGHILVEEAGATFEYLSENRVHYNKLDLRNPSFLVRI